MSVEDTSDGGDVLSTLPNEMWCAVLHLLTPEWLRPCAFVCRLWRTLLGPRANSSGFTRWYEDCAWLCRLAAEGHLPLIRWAIEEGCPGSHGICAGAARGGHIDIIRWARERGYAWNTAVPYEAARGGHLEILRWLHENNCPFNVQACWGAAECGHVDVLEWLYLQGLWSNDVAEREAARNGHVPVLRWILENGGRLSHHGLCSLDVAAEVRESALPRASDLRDASSKKRRHSKRTEEEG